MVPLAETTTPPLTVFPVKPAELYRICLQIWSMQEYHDAVGQWDIACIWQLRDFQIGGTTANGAGSIPPRQGCTRVPHPLGEDLIHPNA